MINTEPFCIRSYPTITKSFIEKIDGIKIYVPFQDSFIKIYGILKKDSLGLSKDDFPFREKYGEVLINLKHLDIPDNFKYGYLQQMSLRDFISVGDWKYTTFSSIDFKTKKVVKIKVNKTIKINKSLNLTFRPYMVQKLIICYV